MVQLRQSSKPNTGRKSINLHLAILSPQTYRSQALRDLSLLIRQIFKRDIFICHKPRPSNLELGMMVNHPYSQFSIVRSKYHRRLLPQMDASLTTTILKSLAPGPTDIYCTCLDNTNLLQPSSSPLQQTNSVVLGPYIR